MKTLTARVDDGLVDFIHNYAEAFGIGLSSVIKRLILLGIYCEQNHEKLGMPKGLVDIVGPVCTLTEHKKFCNVDHTGECHAEHTECFMESHKDYFNMDAFVESDDEAKKRKREYAKWLEQQLNSEDERDEEFFCG